MLLFLIPLLMVSEDVTRDVSVELELPSDWELNKSYENLAVVRNEDHETGRTDNLQVTLYFKLYHENILWKEFNTTTSLNRFTRTNTGKLNLTEKGVYELCVEVEALNFIDYNSENNKDCETINIGVEKLEVDECDCELKIRLSEKIMKQGETQRITLDYCRENNQFKHPVTYWVENVLGETTKSKLTTTNPSAKSYTPSINFPERGFIVKAEVEECNLKTEELFVLYNEKDSKPFLEIETEDVARFGDEIIIRIKGNKGDSNKRVLTINLERDNTKLPSIRMHINEGNFDFQIPYKIPEKNEEYTGMYYLKAEGLDLDTEEKIFLRGIPEEEEIEKGKITNLYTRQQVFSEKINVFITTENTFSDKIILKSSEEEKEIIANQRTVNSEIKINHPNEIVKAQLYQNEEVVDEKAIKLELEDRRVEINRTANVVTTQAITPIEKEKNNSWIYIGIAGLVIMGVIFLKPKGF